MRITTPSMTRVLVALVTVVTATLASGTTPAMAAPGEPFGSFDFADRQPDDGASTVKVRGWAIDPDQPTAAVQVHAYVDGKLRTARTANLSRPDVGQAYPEAGDDHGFSFRLNVAAGTHQVCIYAINIGGGTNPRIGCRTVTVDVNPFGGIDAVNRLIDEPDTVVVKGFAIDPDTTNPINVHVYADGRLMKGRTANVHRSGTNNAFPGYGNGHGFSVRLDLPPGGHRICVYAINVFKGTKNPLLGCTTSVVRVDPFGHLDQFTFGADTVAVGGWAIDRDTAASTTIDLHVDGLLVASSTADRSRSDVAAAYPGYGPLHGFLVSDDLDLAPGPHQACAYATNLVRGSGTVLLGCRNIVV